MLNGLKNFAVNRVLRHVADNAKLNAGTNVLAVGWLLYQVINSALDANANWALIFQCCRAQGSLAEVLRIVGVVLVAVLLWLCGKFPGLKQWLPVAQDVIQEAEKEANDGSHSKAD